MNLLITGGAGFIGSNLIHHVIDRRGGREARQSGLPDLRRASGESGEGRRAIRNTFSRRWICATRPATLRVVETARHHARHASRGGIARGPFHHRAGRFHHHQHRRHVQSARSLPRILERVQSPKSQSQTFHHVSTDEVYGSLGATGLFTETTPYAPNSPYSASKASSDFLVRAYHHTYGLPTVITNCSNNYGPFQFPEKLIPVVIQSILARKPVPVYGDGMNVRDWLYVRDHAEALWTVLQQGQNRRDLQHRRPQRMGEPPHRGIDLRHRLTNSRRKLGGNSRKLISFVKDRPGHDRRYAIDADEDSARTWLDARAQVRGRHPRDDSLVSRQSGVGEGRVEEMTDSEIRMTTACQMTNVEWHSNPCRHSSIVIRHFVLPAACVRLVRARGGDESNSLVWHKAADRVNADIHGEALWPLLEDIAHQTGWHIFVEPGTERNASTKFKDLPPDDALRMLLGNLNFAFVPQTNGPDLLYVFTTQQGKRHAAGAARPSRWRRSRSTSPTNCS